MEALSEYRRLWVFLSILVALKVYNKLTTGRCRSHRRLQGRTAIVTGANAGIGKETALDLARRGARVVMACRNLEKARVVQKEIVELTGNPNVEVRYLDLSHLQSVRDFVRGILDSEEHLDILVNNAGMPGNMGKRTKDGLDFTIQINHLGHVLLTHLLIDLLRQSAPARVVFVSSLMHKFARLDPDDLNLERMVPYSNMVAYSNSKLCNILSAAHLATLLKGTGVTVNSIHPGAVMTDIWEKTPNWMRLLAKLIIGNFYKDSEEGAQTTIYAAVSEEVEGVTGKYFSDCRAVSPSKEAQDPELARRVWEKSCELVGVPSSILTSSRL